MMNKLGWTLLMLVLFAGCTTDEDKRRASEATQKSFAVPTKVGTLSDGRTLYVATHHIAESGGTTEHLIYFTDVPSTVTARPAISSSDTVESVTSANIAYVDPNTVADAKIAEAKRLLQEAEELYKQGQKEREQN